METKFVGRKNELTHLTDGLNHSIQGNGQIQFIAGEAGSGKTALLSMFIQSALGQHPDLVVGIGTCNSHSGISDPFLPFRDILAMFTGDVERELGRKIQSSENKTRLRDFLKVSGQAIVELGPDLLDIFVPGSGIITRAGTFLAERAGWLKGLESIEKRKKASPTQAPIDPSKIIEQYSNVIKSMAEKQPLIMAIDDLQWADPSSIDLLFHLARQIGNSRVLMIGTYRPEEVAIGRGDASHPFAQILGDLKRYYGNIVLDLDQSDAERRNFVWQLIDSHPNRLGENFREELLHHTNGHALFTVELLRELRERGDIQKDDDGLWYLPTTVTWHDLPSQIEGVIETRVGRLDSSDLEVLQIGCVEGELFTGEVVAKVLDVDPSDLIRRLSSTHIRKHDLISAESTGRINSHRISRFQFRHVLFQKYLYSMLEEAELSYLHEDIGIALENLYGDCVPEISVQLTRHFMNSGNHKKAVDYLLITGNQAHAASAYREAMEAFSQGLKLLEDLAEEDDLKLKALMLHLSLGNTLLATKSPADEQVQDNFNKAVDLSMSVEDGHQSYMAIRGLSYHKKMRGDFEATKTFENQMLKMAQNLQDPVLLMESHRLLAESLMRPGAFEAAQTQYLEADSYYDPVEHSKYIGLFGYDPGIIVQSQLAYITWSLGYPERAISLGQESLRLARELNHPLSHAAALDTVSALYHQLRDPVTCQDTAHQCIELSSEYGFLMWEARAKVRRGWALSMSGLVDDGILLIEEGLKAFRMLGMKISIPCMWALLAEAQLIAGQFEACLSSTKDAIDAIEQFQERYCEVEIHRIKGDCLAKLGNATEAEASYRHAVEIALSQKAKSLELRARLNLVKLLITSGHPEEEILQLEGLFNWFQEGFNTQDLIETKTLLDNHHIGG
jgi:tetratricopeptide (TPR) repeat protein